MTYDAIDQIRMNCGGAGYSVWSFLPELHGMYSPTPIYEGDNTVMAQQSISYIVKIIKRKAQSKTVPYYFDYLQKMDELVNTPA